MDKLAHSLPKGTGTAVAVSRHPLHPALVTFPIAFIIGALPSDLAYLWFGDEFWARASLWLLGVGTLMGGVAGAAGTVELLAVQGIRHRAAAWSHFVMAVMLLSVAFINWQSRLHDAQEAILPMGLYLSALGAVLVAAAGWLGGKLVFEDQVGVHDEEP
ncbi:DUF2231 domain-containing protein [Bordetella sp. 15P40C-2]|uniref:DUF2231 domain-containing protein n=1 Tax=Bordetella sp. 15P40C-2 TaxID=2572246 RepID=UPI00132A4B41|nr:DUF2231 domain-containing protein [Bordetella sp. 15P40C-2]MVW70067.1 DUF2231 domain-containing protein [Bordetella sp. 15P40C-2]